jgi:hypothetical protein
VAVTLLRVQEVSGLSFALESVCLADLMWFYWAPADKVLDFNCCLSVHVDNYTIIVPTKCTCLLKAQDITICTFLSLYS